VKQLAEDKLEEFMGYKLTARIGEVNGGIFRDMILQDVAFFSSRSAKGEVFRLERIEISYRIWEFIIEELGLEFSKRRSLESLGMYFSSENPIVRGFLKLYRYPERIELFGRITPVLFEEEGERSVRGIFLKRKSGEYDCDLLWDGEIKVTGMLDPSGRAIDLGFVPLSSRKGTGKISGSVNEAGSLRVYSRLDKVSIFGTEVIADLWISYKDSGVPVFSVEAENLVVNKQPFWDFTAEGKFFPREKKVFFDKVRWGEAIVLTGNAGTYAPYPVSLQLSVRDMELKELAEILGNTGAPVSGMAEMKIDIEGPIRTAAVKGRLYIGEGVLDNMEFRSMFATLEGKLPVVRIADSRVVKDGGQIIVSGEMDFGKLREGKAFDGLVFETDNRVAVWEDWQISKEEKFHVVEARKDRVTLSTSIEDDGLQEGPGTEYLGQKGVGFKYEFDASSSIKLNFEEEDDFFGLEHKIQF